MPLVCTVVLSATSYAAGSTPPPSASIVCSNTGASALVVTGVQLTSRIAGCSTPGQPTVMGNALPPYGPGAPVYVAAGSTSTVGPFPVTVGSAAAGIGGVSQPSQVPDYQLVIGAVVTASDGSINTAIEAGMTVSYALRPRIASQGGQLNFNTSSNSAGWFFL